MTKRNFDKDKVAYIYGLVDPFENEVKYVGWSFTPQKRLTQHIYDAKNPEKSIDPNSPKNIWIRNVLDKGERILIEILETTTFEFHNDRERYWIKFFGRKNLTNGTDGGDDANKSWSGKTPSFYYMKKRLSQIYRKNFISALGKYCETTFGKWFEEVSEIEFFEKLGEGKEEYVKNFLNQDFFIGKTNEEIEEEYYDYLYGNIEDYTGEDD